MSDVWLENGDQCLLVQVLPLFSIRVSYTKPVDLSLHHNFPFDNGLGFI